jgi:hypothetical protein
MEAGHVNKITNVKILNVINRVVTEEMILYHAQNIQIVVLNIIVMLAKIIHICLSVKFYVLLMNSVVKPMNVDRVFIVALLILRMDHYTIIG